MSTQIINQHCKYCNETFTYSNNWYKHIKSDRHNRKKNKCMFLEYIILHNTKKEQNNNNLFNDSFLNKILECKTKEEIKKLLKSNF